MQASENSRRSYVREVALAALARLPYSPRVLVGAIMLAVGYYAGVHVGIAFTLEPNAISILWPPNALVLAALLLSPPRAWWLLIAAVFPAHMLAELSLGVPFSMALFWFVSNVSEGLLGAGLLIHYLRRVPSFDRIRDVSAFLVIAVVTAPLVTSFLDAAFVALAGWRYTDYWHIWRMRLFSNALAEITLVPMLLFWFQGGLQSLRRKSSAVTVEATMLFAALCLTSVLIFNRSHTPDESVVLMYAPLPFLMWAAVRHGVAGVTACVFAVSILAILGVLSNRGPFTSGTPESAALSVQVVLVLTSASLMLLAASLAELRKAKTLAVQQKESLNLALGAAHVGTWEWDVRSDSVAWRMGHEENAQTSDGSHSFTELMQRVHPDDKLKVTRAIDGALAGHAMGELEFRFLCGETQFCWITTKGSILFDTKGKPDRMIGVYIDNTQRKLEEMQARDQREQLTHLSRVATLGELSGALAHELNQPLTAIVINAQAGRRVMNKPHRDLAEIDECLADIVAEGKRAGEVIGRLRMLFKKGVVQRQRINANDCVREVLALEHSDFIMRNIIAELHFAQNLRPIEADRIQLVQVFLNIIVNACDAMASEPSGERRLLIATSNQADGNVQIDISDTGPGVGNPDAVFEPFFTTKHNGVGLGLAICRTIVASHGGRLWASNNRACGMTFHISLPSAPDLSAGFGGPLTTTISA